MDPEFVFTIKYINILIQILIHSFIVKLRCLMNTVTALLEYLDLVYNFLKGMKDRGEACALGNRLFM